MFSRCYLLLGLAVATFAVLANAPLQAEQRPNVLFLFADDQAYDTIAALGNSEIQTPNLDRLVKRGVTFTHAYNQGGWHGAVCVASRTMLVTGRNLWHAQEAEKRLGKEFVPQQLLWPQLMASAGYDTYFTGKWHIGADAAKVFQTARHVRGGMPMQTPAGYNRPQEGKEDVWQPWDPKFGGFWQGGKHWTEVTADDAIDYLGMARESDNPFFMYIAFNAPHDPRQSPREYVERYPLEKLALPQPFLAEYPYQIGSNRIRDEQLAPFPRTEHAVKVNRQEYYAIITHLDDQLGRILHALDKTGQADNTYIFFTADHGLACGHHGLMGKQNMYDHSVRVPLMLVGPDVPEGKRIEHPVYLQDVMPTALEIAGAKIPDHVEFRSLLPQLQPEAKPSRSSIYGAYTQTQRMVTQGRYKLIQYPQIKQSLLFDLQADPLEANNLADDPAYAVQLAELQRELLRLQAEFDDPLLKK